MSVDRVDRFSPRSASLQRDDPVSVPRRRDAAPESDAPRRRAWNSPEKLAPGAGRPLPPEIAFLAAHGAPLVMLQYGAAMARRQGATADAVLIAEGLLTQEAFYRALAAELKVPFLDAPEGLAPSTDLEADAARGYARFAPGSPSGPLWLFAPRGADIVRLMGLSRTAAGRPLFAIATPALLDEALRRASVDSLTRAAAHSVERILPHLCVRRALASGAPVGFILAAAWAAPASQAGLATASLLALAFLGSVLLRIYACAHGPAAEERAPSLAEADLPVYSVIVALYREAPVARQLAKAMAALDYPVLCSSYTLAYLPELSSLCHG
ncbi:hypothetical protein [Methylosinus trichosporium]|uniref:Glycosyl transferase n=1 Tax=Methylosinus trichosporium (strain ATCC 35070 / NCIMB 11131 / UNIQEM 75 / OB3b) TaxID=595536 RepID=A0A2D2D2V4_METT3|nr:hypothetical protein [Methylosinus trichosporium]ATQ69296.1 hypothetical protein CQW49_16475 [Methylosinus trichosporium OB3b]